MTATMIPISMAAKSAPPFDLEQLRLDGGTQPRQFIDEEAVRDYAAAMDAGAIFPDITVFLDDEGNCWLADGFHRVHAARMAREVSFGVDVRRGTRADAEWFSYAANKTNGLRRTRADTVRAIRGALTHPRSVGLSDRLIAEHIGVHHETVAAHRKKLVRQTTTIGFSDSDQPIFRKGRDNRVINIASIGQSRSAEQRRNADVFHIITAVDDIERNTIRLISAECESVRGAFTGSQIEAYRRKLITVISHLQSFCQQLERPPRERSR